VIEHRGSRSPLSLGIQWASTVTTIGLEFTLPMLLGYGLDRSLGTVPVVTMVGVLLGLVLGMLHTVRLGRQLPSESTKPTAHRSRRAGDPPSSSGHADPS
jgi:F0F1-type ATP synthase assembly protein I